MQVTHQLEKLRVERRLEQDGRLSPVAEVVLAGTKLNTMHNTFFREVGQVFSLLNDDPSVHCVLVWSDRRVFSAGLDLQEAASDGLVSSSSSDVEPTDRARSLYLHVKRWQADLEKIRECAKPVVVACHGAVIGGAIDLITAADVRVCTRDATFSIAETRVAIVADLGTLQRISAIVGPGMAREMAFTAEKIDAERARHAGLVNSVYDDKEQMLSAARRMCDLIASHSPRTVQGTKLVLNYADEHSLKDGLEHIALFNASFLDAADVQEAVAAFVSQRKPAFRPMAKL